MTANSGFLCSFFYPTLRYDRSCYRRSVPMYHPKPYSTRLLLASFRYTQLHSRAKLTSSPGSILTHPARDLHCTTTTLESDIDTRRTLSERLNDEPDTAAYEGNRSTETLEPSEQELDPSDTKATDNNALRTHTLNQFTEHLQARKVAICLFLLHEYVD